MTDKLSFMVAVALTAPLPPSLREVAERKRGRRECHCKDRTLPQSKIIDFCQPPQGGGQGGFAALVR